MTGGQSPFVTAAGSPGTPALYRLNLFQGFGASVAYVVSGTVSGLFALVLAILLFPLFPTVARATTRWERQRVTLMGVELPSHPQFTRHARWVWQFDQASMNDLLGWATAVGYALLCAFVGTIVASGFYYGGTLVFGGSSTILGITLIALALLIALLAVQIIAPTQLAATTHLIAPRDDQSKRIQELTNSRRAIVDAYEIERRRIERDLHDGAQQFLVTANMKIGEAALILQMNEPTPTSAAIHDISTLLAQAQDDTDRALAALRETVTGVHPQLLSDKGLETAVRDIAMRCPVPVEVRVPHRLPELPDGLRSAAYFLINEAITNVVKYAPDATATVLITASSHLRISIVDTGEGGAEMTPGRGLDGLRQRLGAFGGTLTLSSPPGGPTAVQASIPLLLNLGESTIVDVASVTTTQEDQ